MMMDGRTPWVIVDVQNGMANRLRSLASAMGVAEGLRRPLMLVWVPDQHCDCSFRNLFAPPYMYPFVLSEERPSDETLLSLNGSTLQLYDYMQAVGRGTHFARSKISRPPAEDKRHLYLKTAFMMTFDGPINYGTWSYGQYHLQQLQPVPAVAARLVAERNHVGVHVRSVFGDGARGTERLTEEQAIASASKEYGGSIADAILKWRNASRWPNFLPRLQELLLETPSGQSQDSRSMHRFYLSADSGEAYDGLMKSFPGQILRTPRTCTDSTRCDARGCPDVQLALADLLNLARTSLVLGSGWSSFSEVAVQLGGTYRSPLNLELAGSDFGTVLLSKPIISPSNACPMREDVMNTAARFRWDMWDDAPTNCSAGCRLKNCDGGGHAGAPCCVKRMRAQWQVRCETLPHGCFSENSPNTKQGIFVVDTQITPELLPSRVCPTREDVMNTRVQERWALWDDRSTDARLNCSAGCELRWCEEGRVAPCCVKRRKAVFSVPCVLLVPDGCFNENDTVIDPKTWASPTVVDMLAVPTVITDSEPRCPTREDVMNTHPSKRWSIWDDLDANCTAGCELKWCKGGNVAPCCVRRLKANWAVPCINLPFGCFSKKNPNVVPGGAIVRDKLYRELRPTARQGGWLSKPCAGGSGSYSAAKCGRMTFKPGVWNYP